MTAHTAAIREGRDDQTWRVAEVLVIVAELCIGDVGEAVLLVIVPAMAQL
jgi:hypothetical protein